MMKAFPAFLLLTAIGSGWLEILIDTGVLVVLIAVLLAITVPFWGLGVIFWQWWRAGAFEYSAHPPIHREAQRVIQNAFGGGREQSTNSKVRMFSHSAEEAEK